MILSRVPDEAAALDKFFELLDEHAQRVPKLVAELPDVSKNYLVITPTNEERGEPRQVAFPTHIRLVAYTQDPGFFVYGGEELTRFPGSGFCPDLDWFLRRFRANLHDLRIADAEIFNRLSGERGRVEREREGKRSPK